MSLNIQNLDRLISHLEGLPEEKFDMKRVFTCANGRHNSIDEFHVCGTAACIAGWANILEGLRLVDSYKARDWIGIGDDQYHALFMPSGHSYRNSYPLSRAIRTLKHMRSEYLRTGQVVVDWDAPEPATKPEWTAPRAVEQARPSLPAEIVRFLRPADLEVSA